MSVNFTTDHVDINDTPFDLDRDVPFSMAIWVKSSSVSRIIFSKGNHTSPFNGYTMNMDFEGRFGVFLINTSGSNLLGATYATPINDGVWHHIGFSYDGTSTAAGLELYVDGIQITKSFVTETLSATILNNFNLQIGARNGLSGNAFVGSLSDACIWDDIVSAGGFAQIYNARLKGMPLQIQLSDLLGYWPLDDHPNGINVNTLTFKDLSGNGNNGTGVGGVAEAESMLSYPAYVVLPGVALPVKTVKNSIIKPPFGTPVNFGKSISKELILAAPLNEGTGNNVSILPGYGKTGILTNMDFSNWILGNDGYILNLNGTNEYIRITRKDELSGLSDISVFIKIKSSASSFDVIMSHFESAAGDLRSWSLGTDGSNKIQLILSDDGTLDAGHVKEYRGSQTIIDGLEHTIGFTFSGGVLNLYVDGMLDPSPTKTKDDAITTLFDSSADLTIGCRLSSDAPAGAFPGAVNNVYIWNRGITDIEALKLHVFLYQALHWIREDFPNIPHALPFPPYNCWVINNAAGAGTADDGSKVCLICALWDTKSEQCMYRQKFIATQEFWRGKTLPA